MNSFPNSECSIINFPFHFQLVVPCLLFCLHVKLVGKVPSMWRLRQRMGRLVATNYSESLVLSDTVEGICCCPCLFFVARFLLEQLLGAHHAANHKCDALIWIDSRYVTAATYSYPPLQSTNFHMPDILSHKIRSIFVHGSTGGKIGWRRRCSTPSSGSVQFLDSAS